MNKYLIGISGKIGSGKDTVAEMIQELSVDNYEVRKYAGKLKDIASILTGHMIGVFEERDFKNSDLGDEWGMTVREFLQKLGTEGLRRGLHENVWVNALFADYEWGVKRQPISPWTIEPSRWIITDMRFKNEYEAVKERGGICVRLTRNDDSESTHQSEVDLDDINDWDYVIDNKNLSLSETRQEVILMLKKFAILTKPSVKLK